MVRPTLFAIFAILLLSLGAQQAHAQLAADLAVKMTSDTNTATAGQTVTFTIVGTNHGPAASELNIQAPPVSGLLLTHVDCGPGGPSPDGWFCEYSNVPAGESRTMTVQAVVQSTGSDRVTYTACVDSGGDTIDPYSGNNCTSQKVKIR